LGRFDFCPLREWAIEPWFMNPDFLSLPQQIPNITYGNGRKSMCVDVLRKSGMTCIHGSQRTLPERAAPPVWAAVAHARTRTFPQVDTDLDPRAADERVL
jgi:hypothetical protein